MWPSEPMESTGIAVVEVLRVAVAVVEEVRRLCIPSSHRHAIAEANKPHYHHYYYSSANPPPAAAAVDADDVAAVSGPFGKRNNSK